ncbi:TonB-dependent receptor, partial [Mycobacterium sp.]|uniref:TonB-dependent receptor n=1 Tax=Mycobacterium sp. TaxID=1785 RepID=UPI002C431D3F
QELDDALRFVPGIDLLGYSGEAQHPTSDSLGMRGLGGAAQGISRALVMIDGIPINDAFFGYIQWGRIPLENVDRVEIVRGGGSPLWGNYAEGGVINIITRQPAGEHLTVEGGGGSYGTYRGGLSGAYFPTDTLKIQAGALAAGTDGFQQVPGYERTPFNTPTSFNTGNTFLKGTWTPGNDLVGNATMSYHENHQRLETVLDTNSQRIYSFAGDLRKTFGEAALAATAFYSDSHFTTNNSTYFPDEQDLAATTQALNEIHQVRAHDGGGSLTWSQNLSGPLVRYMVGADIHAISGRDDTDHFIDPDFSPGFSTTNGHGSQTFVGAFAQVAFAPVSNLEVQASGRLQYLHNSDGYDGSRGGVGAVPDQNYTRFDPRLDVRYSLTEAVALRGAWYEAFRAPNIGDQFYTYAAGGFVQLPSPFLRPENAHGGEVGLDYTRPGLRAQFSFYRTDINNYIVIEPTTNPIYSPAGWYVVQNVNVAAVRAQGFESEINWDLGTGVSANLAYTFADSTVRDNPLDPASVGQQIIDVPRNKAAAELTYRNPGGWGVSTQARWSDRTDWASPDHTDPGYPGRISGDPNFLVDLSGSYTFHSHTEIFLQIQNLLDRRYVTTGYSAPSAQVLGAPFQVFAGVRLTVR